MHESVKNAHTTPALSFPPPPGYWWVSVGSSVYAAADGWNVMRTTCSCLLNPLDHPGRCSELFMAVAGVIYVYVCICIYMYVYGTV